MVIVNKTQKLIMWYN